MPDACICEAMHSHDHSRIHEHCMRYFLPGGWAYDAAPGKGLPPSLLLKGRCMQCGGSIDMGMLLRPTAPLPEERYYTLYQKLRTWRPYAVSESGQAYPAAAQRLDWYRMQDERPEISWCTLLVQMLPREEMRDAHFWAAGYQKRRLLSSGEAWPAGSAARFKGEHEVSISPYIGAAKGKRIFVRPFQELKITSAVSHSDGTVYSGLIKAEGETFYLERVTEDMLYSQDEWIALQLEQDYIPSSDFKRQYLPDPVQPLFALTRVLDLEGSRKARTLAVSAHTELLKEQSERDAREVMEQHQTVFQETASDSTEFGSDSGEEYFYRWIVCGEMDSLLEYRIERVPVLTARLVLPE